MAPITRSAPSSKALNLRPDSPSQSREQSEEPSSYNGDSVDEERTRPSPHFRTNSNMTITMVNSASENHDDILHPLREAANRVGRQVEEFAEILDKYNPLKTDDQVEKHEMVYDMVSVLHEVAVDTVEHLRKIHHTRPQPKQLQGMRKPKMRGFLTRDVEDDIDMDADDDDDDASQPSDILDTNDDDLRHWEAEVHTWDLFRRMLELRYPIPGADQPKPIPIHRYSNQAQVYHNFLVNDNQAREHSIVLKWLRDTADDTSEDIDELVKDLQQNADRGEIISHGWIHTKGAIKLQKRINTWSNALEPTASHVQKAQKGNKAENIVTQLDPDAPTRQDRSLEAQDEYFERAIWLGCYELLRRGKSYEEIREWCSDRTEIWRAVSMSGLPEFNDQFLEDEIEYTSTQLWRRTCHALAKRSGGDPYEKAVYGILSGDLISVQGVCKSWDDELFAHYNALLRTKFEKFVVSTDPARHTAGTTSNLPVFDAEQFEGGAPNLNQVIVKKLRMDPTFKVQANEPMKLIQGSIIADDLLDFICQQGLSYSKQSGHSPLIRRIPQIAIANEDNTVYFEIGDHDSMRVLAHMLIALKSLGLDECDDDTMYAIENVLASYIHFLRLAGKEELIPIYAAQLSETRCYDVLSRTMIDITDEEAREVQIDLMFKLGLDISRVVSQQTTNLLAEYGAKDIDAKAIEFDLLLKKEDVSAGGHPTSCRVDPKLLDQPIERGDLLLIRSLEWHMHVDGLWSFTYRTGTDLYKQFLAQGNVTAACQLHTSLSADSICTKKSSVFLGKSLHISDLGHEGVAPSSVMTEDELDALHRHNLLMRHMLSEAKGYIELEKLIATLEDIAQAGDLIRAYQTGTNAQDRRQARLDLLAIMNFLRVNMGFLLKPTYLKTSPDHEPIFSSIRAAYLPPIVLAFNNILHICGGMLSRDNYLECLNLATFVAEAQNDLDELFTRAGKMEELVQAMADDSLALLGSASGDKGTGTVNKRLMALGWTRDIWDVGGKVGKRNVWVDEGKEGVRA